MAMNYRAIQSLFKTKEGKQLWYPTLVKGGTVDSEYIAGRIAEKSSLTRGDVYNVVDALVGEMNNNLMNGLSVRLNGLGTFTAIAKAGGNGVENPEDVNSSQIKSLRIQFTPTGKRTPMNGITRAMFKDVVFQRWSGDPYNPLNRITGIHNRRNTLNVDKEARDDI